MKIRYVVIKAYLVDIWIGQNSIETTKLVSCIDFKRKIGRKSQAVTTEILRLISQMYSFCHFWSLLQRVPALLGFWDLKKQTC